MKKTIIAFFLFFFILSNSVSAIESTYGIESVDKCVNSTYLKKFISWTECNSTVCSNNNITQEINCTLPYNSTDRCDGRVNQCKYMKKSDIGDATVMFAVAFITGMFLFLGLRIQTTNEFSLFKNGMQTLLIILGLFMLLLNMGMAETISVNSGLSENTQNIIGTGIVVVSYGIYLIIFLMMASFLVTALLKMNIFAKEKRRG